MRRVTISDQAYEADLAEAVDVIFEMATYVKDWDWSTLAKMAKLSYNTVYRLGSRVTTLPRWQTFWKLANAVGLEAAFVDSRGQAVTLAVIREARWQPATRRHATVTT